MVEENVYIVKFFSGIDFIIDFGFFSSEWVLENVKNFKVILIMYGYYDYVWDGV